MEPQQVLGNSPKLPAGGAAPGHTRRDSRKQLGLLHGRDRVLRSPVAAQLNFPFSVPVPSTCQPPGT